MVSHTVYSGTAIPVSYLYSIPSRLVLRLRLFVVRLLLAHQGAGCTGGTLGLLHRSFRLSKQHRLSADKRYQTTNHERQEYGETGDVEVTLRPEQPHAVLHFHVQMRFRVGMI